MDIVRLIATLLVCCWFCPSASATGVFYSGSDLSAYRFLTGDAYCAAYKTSRGLTGNYTYNVGKYNCVSAAGGTVSGVAPSNCPANTDLILAGTVYGQQYGTACAACPSGQQYLNGSCVVNNCPSAGTQEGDASNAVQSSGGSSTVCLGGGSSGCGWSGGGTVPQVCANGKCYTFGPFISTGKLCDPNVVSPAGSAAPTSAASAPTSDASCVAKGQCPGTVNGATVCVACSSQTTVKSTSSAASGVATSASGVQTATGTTIGAGITTTTCAGPTCHVVTQTQVINPDGSSSTTTSDQYQDKGTYCQQNPGDIQCKASQDDSSWGGSCGGFTCNGDAVNCAIAQATWKSNCDADASKATQQIADGTNATSGTDFANGDPRIVGASISSGLDQTERYSGSCPEDPSFTVMGKTIAVPFHVGCTWLAYLGNAAVAVCLLAGAKIALGGAQ